MADLNPKKDFLLDKFHLDEEWEKQAILVYDYSEAYSDAIKSRDMAKRALKRLRAQVEKEIRTNPIKFELEAKPKEGAIDAAVELDPRVEEAEQELIETSYQMNIMEGAVDSALQKKSALEHEQKLFFAGYYGDPENQKIPREQRERYEEKAGDDHRRALEQSERIVRLRRKKDE